MADELHDHPGWAHCTFEGARRQLLQMGMKTTFREKLQWIEEAGRVAAKFRLKSSSADPSARPSVAPEIRDSSAQHFER